MKNLIISIILSFSTWVSFGQETEKPLKLFKFNPLQLVTSSLSFGLEQFNEEKNRSSVFTFGLRYRSNDDIYGGRVFNSQGDFIENTSSWKGLTASYERRIYIPAFRDGKANLLNAEKSQYGVYLAPLLRLDYTNNDFDFGYFDTRFDGNGQITSEDLILNSGQRNTLGIMPAINLGIQFSIFQYGYIDLHVGGGLRINQVFQDDRNLSSSRNYSYNQSNSITELVMREGVLPSGGISLGVKF